MLTAVTTGLRASELAGLTRAGTHLGSGPHLECHGKGEDGRARTREVKLGVFFTQDKLDKDGYPVRDRASASIIATFEPAATFGNLVRAEGIRRGADHVRQLTILGDGAAWICYPDIGIADLIPVTRLSRRSPARPVAGPVSVIRAGIIRGGRGSR